MPDQNDKTWKLIPDKTWPTSPLAPTPAKTLGHAITGRCVLERRDGAATATIMRHSDRARTVTVDLAGDSADEVAAELAKLADADRFGSRVEVVSHHGHGNAVLDLGDFFGVELPEVLS